MKKGAAFAILAGLTMVTGGRAAEPVRVSGLVAEMADYAAVARWPEPEFVLREASSHDRRTVAPDRDGWFANDDFSQYLRTETREGREEKVLMDADGPGCIVRFWLTTVQNKRGVLRVYLDGAEKPALSFPAFDLMSGDLHLAEPFVLAHPGYSATDNGGNTLTLPIPYAKHCKVTWEEQGSGPRYYQIEYRTYAPEVKVETFSMKVLEGAREEMKKAGALLMSPPPAPRSGVQGWSDRLKASTQHEIDLPEGPGALRYLALKLDVPEGPEKERILRSLIVKLSFDGEDTVWCPATDFFGSGVGINVLRNWYRTVEADGTMSCRWVMPYGKTARITLMNAGAEPVGCSLHWQTGPWKWDARSMHFHSAWRYEGGLVTPPARDWNFITLGGRGVYVGDTLSLYNPAATWYGEGDDKIRVDGEEVPSHLGTGTEDYYNYSFAPRGIMQTPFANHTRIDQPMTQGHNVMTRSRNLDGIPFRKSLDFQMELIPWKPTKLIYAATTYWYAFPGGSSNGAPNFEDAAAAIPTLADAQAPPPSFPGAVEAEGLTISATSEGLVHEVQDMEVFGTGMWSGGKQLLLKSTKAGDFVTVEIPVSDSAAQKLSLVATKAPEFATLEFTVNGKKAETDFDGYATAVVPSAEIVLGTFAPVDGKLVVRIQVSGANAASGGAKYYAGLDYFKVAGQ